MTEPRAREVPPTPSVRRKALNKKDLQELAAVELLSLLQSVTADGKVATAEVHELRDWLHLNERNNIPGFVHLKDVIEQCLEDGAIDEKERKLIHKAIESVLPSDVRQFAKERRTEVELEEKAARAQERAANTAFYYLNAMVAGVRYPPCPVVIEHFLKCDDEVFLLRDRANAYSRYAIRVLLANGMSLGWIPDQDAQELAPLPDSGTPYTASISRILDRARVPIPIVIVKCYRLEATVQGLRVEANSPQMVMPPAHLRTTYDVKGAWSPSTSKDLSVPSSDWQTRFIFILIAILLFVFITSR